MALKLEVWNGSGWIDKTDSCVSLRRQIRSNGVEELDGELVKDVVSVGQEIRLKEDDQIVFEGIVYEVDRRHRGRDVERCGFKAYDYLIKYDRHVVYRLYQTGTKAGEIIKDLASLEDGVDVSNVDDGDSLLSPWEIENQKALDVMKSVARGVNYWLRMKPGKILYFKPKQVGSAKATITDQIILDAEYSEDRWKLKNRVIYVGAGGEILADVSEGAGDLPVVVHDPFLTDKEEAERRAKIRLALNKEYGRSLRITMHQKDFKDLGIDLGDTCIINLPSVGLENENMVLLGIEYDPRSLRYRLEFGGRKELLEDWLDEQIGGDAARRFGQAMTLPEETSTLTYSLEAIARIQGESRYVKYWNKPPLTLYNVENIQLNDDGYAVLTSGATEGSFEAKILPPSEMFISFMDVTWGSDKGDGSVTITILRGDDSIVKQISGDDVDEGEYWFDRLPRREGEWFEGAASNWGKSNGDVSDVTLGILHPQNLKLTPDTLGTEMTAYYPRLTSFERHYDGSGSISFGIDRVTVDSFGSGDFWGYNDGGSALFIPRYGHKEVVVEVLDPGASKWRRMLMLRGSLASNSRFLAILFDGDASHLTLAWRKSDGAKAEWLGEDTGSAWDGTTPFYLKFRLENGVWKAYWSKDKENWIFIGEKNASDFDGDFNYIGLCATFHGNGKTVYSRGIWLDDERYFIPDENPSLDLSWAKYMRLYLYGDHPEAKDFSVKIRLHTDADNYYEGTINVKHGTWKKYEVLVSSLSQVGSPNLSNINWISILTPYELLIDGDYVFLPLTRELVRVKFELSRPSADADSPKIKFVKIGWREGT